MKPAVKLALLEGALLVGQRQMARVERANSQRAAQKAAVPDVPDYPRTRRQYRLNVYAAVSGYLDSRKGVGPYKSLMGRSVIEAFSDAFYAGFSEAGADETERDDEQWLTARTNTELGFVDDLFATLKDMRATGIFDAEAEADARAEGYAATLDGVFSEGRLRGSKARTLEFFGDDGDESCETCLSLKGKRRTIRWILANDMIPRPGNANFKCNGYKCKHGWRDPKTKEVYTF